jgi:hypothetical protein
MNASELAAKMLEWEKNKRALDALGAEIEAEVLKIGKTQTVGNCRVTYSGGRSSYDYQTPAAKAPPELLEKYSTEYEIVNWDEVAKAVPETVKKFTTIETQIDYKAICKEAKLEPVELSTTAPTATIKLEK